MMTGLLRIPILLLILLITVSSVGFKLFSKHFENYFPLEEGRVLEYEFTRKKGSDINEKGILIVTNLSSKMIDKKSAVARKYEIKNKDNSKTDFLVYFHNDKSGILFLATQTNKDSQPKLYPTPFYYIKNPLEVGTFWGGGEQPKGQIESVDETVTVPAGTFDKCLKVKITYPQNMPMAEAFFWFAERIGIVKSHYKYKDSREEDFQLTAIE